MNPWNQTQTGKAFDLVAPTADMVDPLDIAVRLARANRFCGSELRISVAQHSVLAAAAAWRSASWAGYWAPSLAGPVRRARLLALHDAAETYIGDVFGPTRRWLTNMTRTLVAEYADSRAVMKTPPAIYDLFGVLEDRILGVIYAACGVTDTPTADEQRFIKEYDQRQLAFEKTWFVQTPEPQPWWPGKPPEPFTLTDYGANLDSHRGLRVAKLVTETWSEETAAGMYLALLNRLGLLAGVDRWRALGRVSVNDYEAIDLLFSDERA